MRKNIIFLFLLPFVLSAQSLTDSLKAYYPFTGGALDVSGYGHNPISVSAVLAPDRFGNPNEAYSFNGINQDIEFTASAELRPTTFPVSMSIWFNSSIIPTGLDYYQLFCTEFDPVNGNYSGYWMNVEGNTCNFALTFGDNTGACSAPFRRTISSTVGVCDGQWHLLTGVIYSATNMQLYLDCQPIVGVLSGSGALFTGYLNSPTGKIGHKNCGLNPNTYYMNGSLDEARFYNRALTQQDVVALYNYPNPPSGISVNLGNDTTLCGTNSYTLNASTPGVPLSYSWSTGATTPSINITNSGTYWVSVDFGSCQANTDTINVVMNANTPANSALSLGPDVALCQFTGNYSLNAATPGAVSYLWNTGATTPTITVQNPGTYWVETVFGNCTYDRDSIVITQMSPTPGNLGLNLGQDTTVCVGPYFINATISGAQGYLWSTGATTPTITVATTGTYSVEIFGPNCITDKDTVMVTILSTGITLVPDTLICKKGTVTLNAPPGYNSYLWSNGSTATSLTTSSPGTYALTVTAANGCAYTDSISVMYVPYSIPSPNFTWTPLSVQGNVYINQFNSISSGVNMSYFWDFGNGVTSTMQNPIITLNCGVSYPVMLVVYNECGEDTTYQNVLLNPCVTGLEENMDKVVRFKVYPQPADKTLTLAYYLSNPSESTVSIYNVLGEEIKKWEILSEQGQNQKEIAVEELTRGIYYLKLTTNQGQANIPVILE